MFKKFIKQEKAQAFVETIIFIFFVYMIIAIAVIHFGLIQLIRERIQMANFYMGHTYAGAKTPDKIQNIKIKARSMLKDGTPCVYIGRGNQWISKLQPCLQSGDTVNSQIIADFKVNSSIMKKIISGNKLSINSANLQFKKLDYK